MSTQRESEATAPEQLVLPDAVMPQMTEDAPPQEELAPQEEIAPSVDYAKMAEEDLATIREKIPAMKHLASLTDLAQFERFATLREAGLSAEEAFWATCHSMVHAAPYDNRSHLRSASPRGASGASYAMTADEMAAARDLFSDLSDAEIRTLYAKCRT